jgi:hypothetical protein
MMKMRKVPKILKIMRNNNCKRANIKEKIYSKTVVSITAATV